VGLVVHSQTEYHLELVKFTLFLESQLLRELQKRNIRLPANFSPRSVFTKSQRQT